MTLTFQSNELRAVEVDDGQQRRAVAHVFQQVVQQGEVLQRPTRQVISAITHLNSHSRPCSSAFISQRDCTDTDTRDFSNCLPEQQPLY